MVRHAQPQYPPRTADEADVLDRLLPGETLDLESDRATLTCGGCTASPKEWRALGLLMDLVLANQTGRMSPRHFQRRVIWTHDDPGAHVLLMLAACVAIRHSGKEKRYQEGVAACKRRDELCRHLVGYDSRGAQASAAFSLAGAADFTEAVATGIGRVFDMLDGVARATHRTGAGGRCWLVRSVLCKAVLDINRLCDSPWESLGALCGRMVRAPSGSDARKPDASTGGFPGFIRSVRGHLYGCVREHDAAALPLPMPEAEAWCAILRAVVMCAGIDGRKDTMAGDALRVLGEAVPRLVDDTPGSDGYRALAESCRELTAMPLGTGGSATLDQALDRLNAMFEQVQQCTEIRRVPGSRTKRRMA